MPVHVLLLPSSACFPRSCFLGGRVVSAAGRVARVYGLLHSIRPRSLRRRGSRSPSPRLSCLRSARCPAFFPSRWCEWPVFRLGPFSCWGRRNFRLALLQETRGTNSRATTLAFFTAVSRLGAASSARDDRSLALTVALCRSDRDAVLVVRCRRSPQTSIGLFAAQSCTREAAVHDSRARLAADSCLPLCKSLDCPRVVRPASRAEHRVVCGYCAATVSLAAISTAADFREARARTANTARRDDGTPAVGGG